MKKALAFILFSITVFSTFDTLGSIYRVKNIGEYNAAIPKLQHGDTVMLLNGSWKDVQLTFTAKGSPCKPIVLTVEHKGKVIIEGASNLCISGEWLVVSGLVFRNGYSTKDAVIEFRTSKDKVANHCRVTECAIDHFNIKERFTESEWITLWGKNNRVDHCYFAGKSNTGVTVGVHLEGDQSIENNHSVDHNYFAYRPRLGSNGGETIRVGNSQTSLNPSKTYIVSNYFEHCNGETEIVSIKSCDNVVAQNVFFECEGSVVLRHGNRNLVFGNYFFGNHKTETGGIRVINAGHQIYNNYLYGLTGADFRGGLVLMQGIPNSPPNRYHQVKDVDICYNTWIDCKLPWQFCVGIRDVTDVVNPIQTRIANNLISCGNEEQLIKEFADVSGIEFDNNIVNGKIKGSYQKKGYIEKQLNFEANLHTVLIPVYNSVFEGKGEFGFVTTDIEGKPRNSVKTVGALETNGRWATLEMASPANCGIRWYTPQPQKYGLKNNYRTVVVKPGQNTINEAIKTNSGNIILELSEGEYVFSQKIKLTQNVTIKGIGKTKPVLLFNQTDSLFFEIVDGACLSLQNLTFKGSNKVKYVIKAISVAKADSSTLYVDNCDFTDFKVKGGSIFHGTKNTFADTLSATHCQIKNCNRFMNFSEEKDDKGSYNVEHIFLKNCQFENLTQSAIDIYRGGKDESTFGPFLTVAHCEFRNIAHQSKDEVLKLTGVQNVNITNSTFTGSPQVQYLVKLYGKYNSIDNSIVVKSGKINAVNGALIGSNITTR